MYIHNFYVHNNVILHVYLYFVTCIGRLTQGDRMQPVGHIKEDFTFEYVGDNSNETLWPGKVCTIFYATYESIFMPTKVSDIYMI